MNMDLTHDRARHLFDYDAETGVLSWRVRRGNVAAGTAITSVDGKGHLRVRVDKTHYAVHRMVWLWVFGEWPREQVDHVDHDKKNNRIGNLRDVSNQLNNQNRPDLQSNNTSGIRGVAWDPSRNKWYARIKVDGKLKNLGRFDTAAEATRVRHEATNRFHAGFIECVLPGS